LAFYSGIVLMPPSLASTLLQLNFSRVFELTFPDRHLQLPDH
jgi:hypothetical protein